MEFVLNFKQPVEQHILCTRVYVYTYIRIQEYTRTQVYIHTYTHTYIYIHICTYTYGTAAHVVYCHRFVNM